MAWPAGILVSGHMFPTFLALMPDHSNTCSFIVHNVQLRVQAYSWLLDNLTHHTSLEYASILDMRGNHDVFDVPKRQGKELFTPSCLPVIQLHGRGPDNSILSMPS